VPFPPLDRLRWPAAPLLGVLATTGFAPYGLWYFSIVALALLFVLCARATPRHAAALTWLYGFAHFLSGIYWVYISTHVYGGAPAWLGALLAFSMCAALAVFPAVALGLAARFKLFHSGTGWIALPMLWLVLELLRGGLVFGGLPWLSLGELAVDMPLLRLLPLVGVHGISAVIVLLAYALYRIGIEHALRARAIAGAALLAPLLGALLLPRPSWWTQADGDAIPVALVQSNIRQDEKWLPAMRTEALSRHWRLTQQAWPAELVIWPEVALTQPYHALRQSYLADLDRQSEARDATVLLGILVFDSQEQHYNSVITLGANEGRYDKRHLVPFGEYFPIPDFMRPLMDVLGTPYRDFAFGARDQPLLTVNGRRVAVSICFEDVFGNEIRRDARDAAYLVNVTNDAWFGTSSAPHQHLAFSRLRAMENGRWFARTANTGISALINPDGEVVARTAQFEQQVLRGQIEPRRGVTPYMRWGDAPLWWGSALTLTGLLFFQHRSRESGSKTLDV
jgi:apolipoprotein N-acyltransferase